MFSVSLLRRHSIKSVAAELSADRRILVVKHGGTWLFSHSPEGRVLATTGGLGGIDVSGLFRPKRAVGRPFAELLGLHQERLSRYGAKAAPFTESSAMEAFRVLEARRVDLMVSRRLARYTDAEQGRWRYTALGALRHTLGVMILPVQMAPGMFGRRRG